MFGLDRRNKKNFVLVNLGSLKMRIIKFVILILFMGSAAVTRAQLLDTVALEACPTYTNLAEALKDPDKVIKLSLRKKKYKEFPREIYQFKNLQWLDLSKNAIKELPDSVAEFKFLQFFSISKNGLERLPLNIGKLKNLKYINVNQNNLTRLPYTFGDLENLEFADLWSNSFDEFPESLKNLKKLRSMDLRNILIPKNIQQGLESVLPKAIIYFSPPCNCSW